MHGERDILSRFVFPELRFRGKAYNIDITEGSVIRCKYLLQFHHDLSLVDLRWGITEQESQADQTLGICLDEIASCNYFVGILGERYGWAPSTYVVPKEPRFDWIREYPTKVIGCLICFKICSL